MIEFSKYLYYAPDSPSGLRWKVDIWVGKRFNRRAIRAGDVAGCSNKMHKYYTVRLQRKGYKNHHVVLVLHGIEIPSGMLVDHIDGNKLNNRFENLRVVGFGDSNKNRIYNISNSEIPYVHYSEKLNRYQVALVLDGKRYTKTFPISRYSNAPSALDTAIDYLISKEQKMLDSGYTLRQINNIKERISDYRSKNHL